MTDVTEVFKRSCSDLLVTQVVKVNDLGYLEAMNALQVLRSTARAILPADQTQILDQKMDTGVVSLNSRSDFDPQAALTPKIVCWIVDQMLVREIAWYRGATLAQTVYTCLLFHHPDAFASQYLPESSMSASIGILADILSSYTLAWIKTIDVAYTELNKGHVTDGEDCLLDHQGLAVQMADSVVDIAARLDQATDALTAIDDDWSSQLYARVQLRKHFLLALDILTCDSRDYWEAPEIPLILEEIKRPPDPASVIRAVFESRIVSSLKQNMPLPAVPDLNDDQVYEELTQGFQDLQQCFSLGRSGAVTWELVLRNLTWSRTPWSLIRSLLRTALLASPTAASISREGLVDGWIETYTGLSRDVLSRLSTEMATPQTSHLFSIWRDLASSYMIATMSVPLLNRPRQRRAYQSLSYAWYERAVTGKHFPGVPQVDLIVTAMHDWRLDCLLNGALTAFRDGLIGPFEETESWWWIFTVASARATSILPRAFATAWAQLWSCIGAGMQLLLARFPPVSTVLLSRQSFNLRHKWARKLPEHPDPSGTTSGITADFETWCIARQVLGDLTPNTALERGVCHLQGALTCVDDIIADRWDSDVASLMTSIKLQLQTMLEAALSSGQHVWRRNEQSVIPRLMVT